ncbi:MAG: glycine--tRNA ligase subunit beta [Alphaproteobacteria bacterium]
MPELLIELFSEEIPARMQARAAEDFARLVTEGLKAAGLSFGKVEKFVAPRRVGLAVADIPGARADVREERRGPRVGAPEQALQGFLKSVGLASIDQCEKREVKGAAYYFAVIEQKGGATAAALPDIVASAIRGLAWPKSMRWAATRFTYVRPLHGIVAVFDGKVVPGRFDCGGGTVLEFGNKAFGHRFLAPGFVEVADAATYRERLKRVFVVADPAERKERIRQEARALAAAHDLALKDDDALLDEVTGLVEWPVPMLGRIDAESMALPPEVLITSMRAHQKYFALETPERTMAPHFLVVANMVTGDGGAAVVAGNERVLRARLADARFFWDTDRKTRLADRVKALDTITWHAKLGTSGEKVRRVRALAAAIAKHVPGADAAKVDRAAELAKADLVTGMVGEFPELQGVMGRYYALHDKEDAAVANAIAEHWGPVGPSDACPTAPVSVAVALADKIDSLVGFFAIDEKPTGSKDPYALRRAALGVIRLLVENRIRLPLVPVFSAAWSLFAQGGLAASHSANPPAAPREGFADRPEAVARDLLDFFADRLKVALREKGVRHDLIDAVFALGGEDDLVRLLARVEALRSFIESDDGRNLLVAYRRAANIVKIEAKKDKRENYGAPEPARYAQDEEKALAAALDKVAAESGALVGQEDFAGAMRLLAGLRRPVDAFFDKVTVNAPEKELRLNRLALLQRLAATMDRIADFSRIEG